jgi:GT2 family glycosyltransferase
MTGTWCCELELSTGAVDAVVPRGDQERARVLVRLHGDPLGYLPASLPLDGSAVAAEARARFADRIAQVEADDRTAPDGDPVSVVVCTRDRAAQLVACLDRLARLTYPRLEIVVVDNAPTDDSTRDVVAAVTDRDSRFRYVREPRPGLSRARNAGLAAATGRYLAYTDDDVAVDPGWIQGLLRGFGRAPGVGCVTGLVATADIAGAAEEYFDARAASWSTRCEPLLFALDGPGNEDPLFPYSPGVFGTGANLAFDRELLVGLGAFDEALGAGTRTRGGEDLDIFVRVLRAGRAIAYEPAALVWHHHRADREALLGQMYGYGTGLSAFLTKCLLQGDTRRELLGRIPLGLRRMAAIRSTTRERLAEPATAPRGALLREFAGFGAGPLLYLQARRAVRTAPGGRA